MITGIHHVTALARGPQANFDFYTQVLGLRLVKRTVNFDDPGTYHLYYGNELGAPGSILTFFPWPLARLGHAGAGQATATSFSVPADSLSQWEERLRGFGIEARRRPAPLEDGELLSFTDPDGLLLELAGRDDIREPWQAGPVPAGMAIRGLSGVTLTLWNPERTAELLTGTMGFRPVAEAGGRFRFAVGTEEVDLQVQPAAERGRTAAGTVHHVAWRVGNESIQLEWLAKLAEAGLHVTPVQDRQYFRSIYFREPGGVLFEIATDPPGFTWDEPAAELGRGLKLPPWLEPSRDEIAAALPPLQAGGAA